MTTVHLHANEPLNLEPGNRAIIGGINYIVSSIEQTYPQNKLEEYSFSATLENEGAFIKSHIIVLPEKRKKNQKAKV
jgi:hypothetical protein